MSTRGLLIAVGGVNMLTILSCMTQAVNIREAISRGTSAKGTGILPRQALRRRGASAPGCSSLRPTLYFEGGVVSPL